MENMKAINFLYKLPIKLNNFYKTNSKKKLIIKNKSHKKNILNPVTNFDKGFEKVIRKNISKYDAFIAIGCVIKGKTPHFELICKSAFEAMMRISVEFNKPIGNGVITSFNKKQAYERCGIIKSKNVNKGLEAAKAVVSIIENGPKKI